MDTADSLLRDRRPGSFDHKTVICLIRTRFQHDHFYIDVFVRFLYRFIKRLAVFKASVILARDQQDRR